MKRFKHLQLVSRTPLAAQTNFAIKLDSTTEIIDTILLVPRQAPWKTNFRGGIDDGGGDGGVDTGDIGGGLGGGDIPTI